MIEPMFFYIPGIPEAPSDGILYGRKNGAWVPVFEGTVLDWRFVTEAADTVEDWGFVTEGVTETREWGSVV